MSRFALFLLLFFLAIPARFSWAQLSMHQVKALLDRASRFAYVADAAAVGAGNILLAGWYDHWQLPEETEGLGGGDCEDRAIWLYAKLLAAGFEDVRLVIGTYRPTDTLFHAWVVWYPHISGKNGKLESRVYILDPTIHVGIWQANQFPQGYYQPYYSFHRGRRWTHVNGPSDTSQRISSKK